VSLTFLSRNEYPLFYIGLNLPTSSGAPRYRMSVRTTQPTWRASYRDYPDLVAYCSHSTWVHDTIGNDALEVTDCVKYDLFIASHAASTRLRAL